MPIHCETFCLRIDFSDTLMPAPWVQFGSSALKVEEHLKPKTLEVELF